jgi:hypothetical protein
MFDDVQLDTFVRKQLHRPLASSFGWSGASDLDQVGFGATVEDEGNGWSETFFSFECRLESFFDEAFSKVSDGIGVAVKLFGNVAIGHSSIFGFIDGEQYIGVFDFLGIAFAGGDELFEFVSFCGGQRDFVNLLHLFS